MLRDGGACVSPFLAGWGTVRCRGGFLAGWWPEFFHGLVAAAPHQVEEHAADGFSPCAVLGQYPALLLHLHGLLTQGERRLRPENGHHGLQLGERLWFRLAKSVGHRLDGFVRVHGYDCRDGARGCQTCLDVRGHR